MSFAAKPSTWTFRHRLIVIEGHLTLDEKAVEGPIADTQATSYQARVNCGRCIVFRR